MFDLWAAENTVLREKVLERVFLTDLSRVLLIGLRIPFEVLRSEFDGHGFDVIVEARGIVRHVQLKATRIGGKRASVDVNLALADKPGGCVVWFMADPEALTVGPFYWLGQPPGEPLDVPDGQNARHSRANALGVKGERKGLRRVPMGKFTRMEGIEEVAMAMFGTDHDQVLRAHLVERGVDVGAIDSAGLLSWEDSAPLAHMIDGYELCEAAGLGDATSYVDRMKERAVTSGQWRGSALELWIALFLEHRRDHFGGFLPGIDLTTDPPPLVDDLCSALVNAIRKIFPAAAADQPSEMRI